MSVPSSGIGRLFLLSLAGLADDPLQGSVPTFLSRAREVGGEILTAHA